MRIVLMSDSHRQVGPVQKIIEQQPDADFFIHLGDSEGTIDLIRSLYPDKKIYAVSGNCDSDISLPAELVIPVNDELSIFAVHGHRYAVHAARFSVRKAAEQAGCRIVCYGHTHMKENTYDDGIWMVNPGSCACPRDSGRPSYAYIDIVDGRPFIAHVDIK